MVFQRQGFGLLRKKKEFASTVKNHSKGQGWNENTSVCHFEACAISPKPCGLLLGKFSVAVYPCTIYSILISYNFTNSEKWEGREKNKDEPQPEFYCRTFQNIHFTFMLM